MENVTSNDDLYGLILAGGQSSRMGRDKAGLDYHGQPHAEYLFHLVSGLLPNTFVSVREGHSTFTDRVIRDSFPTKGPINGILSAMKAHPG